MQINFRGRRWLMQFPPAPPFSLCKVCEADSSLCVCACVYLCIYVHSTHASYVGMHQCGSRNIKALLFSNVLAALLIFIFWCLHFVGMSLRICWFLHVGQAGKSHVNTVLIEKARGFGSRFSTSTGEVHFDKLKIRILIILFGICGAKVAPEPRHSKSLQREIWPRSCRNERGGGRLPFNMKTNFDLTWKQIA